MAYGGGVSATGHRLCVLGPPRLRAIDRPDDPIRLRPLAQRVLSALAFRSGQPAAVDTLVDLVWWPTIPKSASHSLRNVVATLRHDIDPDLIRTIDGGYRLGASVTTDRAELAGLAGDPDAVGDQPWSSDLLAGAPWMAIDDHPDVAVDLRAVARERVIVGMRRARWLADHDEADRALTISARLLELTTNDESVGALHAELLYRSGRRTESLRHLLEVRHQLIDVGLDFGPALQAVEARVLSDSGPADRATVDEASIAVPPTKPFVGRQVELGRLSELVAESGFRTCLITGPPGIGKSTLASTWAASLPGRRTLTARCVEHGAAPLQPLAAALGLDALHQGALRRELADAAPAILIVDDVQWADDATAAALGELIDHRPPDGITLVALSRPVRDERGSLSRLREQLARHGSIIELGTLDRGELADLSRELGTDDIDLDWLQSASGGSPLLASMLLKGGREHATELDALVAAQLASLGRSTVDLIRWVALCSRPQRPGVLAAAAGIDEFELADAAERAIEFGLAIETETNEIDVAHETLRSGVLRDLSGARRAAMHARLRDVLWDLDRPDRWAETAFHALHANDAGAADKAVEATRQAATDALSKMAPTDALRQIEFMLEHLPGGSSPRLRADLLVQASRASGFMFDIERRNRYADEALTIARLRELPELFAAAVSARGHYQVQGVFDEELDKLIVEALDIVELHDLPALKADLMAQRGAAYAMAGQLVSGDHHRLAVEWSRAAVKIADGTDDAVVQADTRSSLVISLFSEPAYDEQLRLADEIQERQSAVGVRAALRAHRWRAIPRLCRGDRDGFRTSVAELGRLASNYPIQGRIEFGSYVAQWRVMELLDDGRWDEAARAIGQMLDEFSDVPNIVLGGMAQLAWHAIETDTVEPLLDAVEQHANQHPVLLSVASLAAVAHAVAGDPDRARPHLARLTVDGPSTPPRDITFTSTCAGIAEAAALLDARDVAAEFRDVLVPWHGTYVVGAGGLLTLGSAERTTAILYATSGEHEPARELFDRAIELEERFGAAANVRRGRAWQARFGFGDADAVAADARRAGQLGLLPILDGVQGPSG